jgi:hypothetical protein
LWPQIGGEETVCLSDGSKRCLHEISHATRASTRGSVTIIDIGESQEFLRDGSSDNSSSTGSRNQSADDRTTFTSDLRERRKRIVSNLEYRDDSSISCYLGRDSVRCTKNGSPVTSTNRNNGKFRLYDHTSNGSGDFLATFDS